jgi:integration host factor subunit beta
MDNVVSFLDSQLLTTRVTRQQSRFLASPPRETNHPAGNPNLESRGSLLTKADLVQEVSRVLEVPLKDGEALVEQIISSMVRALHAGDNIEIRGFGSFRTRQRKARIGRNPKTGAQVSVPPKKVVFFKPSSEVRALVNSSAQ